jgi:hypothetical protein
VGISSAGASKTTTTEEHLRKTLLCGLCAPFFPVFAIQDSGEKSKAYRKGRKERRKSRKGMPDFSEVFGTDGGWLMAKV